jgi:uncharacterized Rmd1/YagE family protein
MSQQYLSLDCFSHILLNPQFKIAALCLIYLHTKPVLKQHRFTSKEALDEVNTRLNVLNTSCSYVQGRLSCRLLSNILKKNKNKKLFYLLFCIIMKYGFCLNISTLIENA